MSLNASKMQMNALSMQSHELEISGGSWKGTAALYQRLGMVETCDRSFNRAEVLIHPDEFAAIPDINTLKQTEHELLIAAAVFEAEEGMTVTDIHGTILRVNKAFTKITGYTAEEIIGKNPKLLKSTRQDTNFYKAMWQEINHSGSWKGELWNRRKNGEIYPEHLSISAVKNAEGKVINYVGIFIDLSESKATIAQLRSLEFFDPLTGLPNRRLMLDRLCQTMASSARNGNENALLFIDLDNFNILNGTLGHDIGDALLQQAAQRLRACVRLSDTVARLGSDEFVVILADLNEYVMGAAYQVETISRKILEAFNRPYPIAEQECYCTGSIGITLFKGADHNPEELMKQADIAMHQAKKDGRNSARFFDSMMQNTINSRAIIERELRNALECDQFQLYYQLQVDASRKPLGAEALIRWLHPERGMIPPDEFILIAEETGVIIAIGQWVLETACAQLKAWQSLEATRNLVLAINVSARQFRQADFEAKVQQAIQRHGINPKLLKLELTESLFLENIEAAANTMNKLKQLGVQFSLDDFGTGYSSLQYLKRLPFDQLKIDRSFVQDIACGSDDMAIVSTIIAMAQTMNLQVIAEGVETELQRKFLHKKGCNRYQGYLFSKPVPIDQFDDLFRAKRSWWRRYSS